MDGRPPPPAPAAPAATPAFKLLKDKSHPTVAIWDGGKFEDQQCPQRVSAGGKFDDVDCGCADDRVDPDPVASCAALCQSPILTQSSPHPHYPHPILT